LERGELFELKLLNLDTLLTTKLGTNTDFTIQVSRPGVVLETTVTLKYRWFPGPPPGALETTGILK